MYITEDVIKRLAEQYGQPQSWYASMFCYPDEFEMIRASQKDGRNHDVTVYIMKADKIVVNAKHFYPPGLFRAPSGGVNKDENFHEGVRREMSEETGCEMKLKRFLLHTEATFYRREPDGKVITDETVQWRSLVFSADYTSGDFNFSDHHEIREVSLADWEDFERFSHTMRKTAIGGFHYRAALHDRVRQILFPR